MAEEYSVDQVLKLYQYAEERELRRNAAQADLTYLAVVNATIAAHNATHSDDYEVPTTLGLLESLESIRTGQSVQGKNASGKPTIKHYTEGALDIMEFFF